MKDNQHQYVSYLLRLWQERSVMPFVWRASLEDPQTGELLGFADIAHLYAFLGKQMADEERVGEQCRDPEQGQADHIRGQRGAR